MISKELMMTILEQNKRSIEAGTCEYTNQVLKQVAEKEPFISMFIESVSKVQAEVFCMDNGLDSNEHARLNMMMQHIGGIVANAFISQKEIEELEK